jgi:signal transduction histidine kinase
MLCELAYKNGGSYMATVSFERGYGIHKSEIFGGGKEDAVKAAMEKAKKGPVGAVYLRIVEKDSTEYIIFQNTDLTPIQSTIDTLQKQFLWIGIVLLLLALVLAFIMSKVITKPIIKINNAAKKLSQGSYDEGLMINGYREIGELSDTLSFASQEISKSDRLQKELISNVSHDLRTPLTMIKGYGEVMRDIPGENTAENIQVIIDESARLSELVNDMLDISRIRAGAREPQMMSFCITDTVRDVLLRYTKLINREGYKIDFVADKDVYVTADSIMMLQVLYNLINNAINYTGEDKRVTVVQQIVDDEVKISVIDTGSGIAHDELPLIFERYYKVDKVHKRATIGTGLGLAIVKGILELHGASYGVESTIGVGSVFWFSIKRDERDDND